MVLEGHSLWAPGERKWVINQIGVSLTSPSWAKRIYDIYSDNHHNYHDPHHNHKVFQSGKCQRKVNCRLYFPQEHFSHSHKAGGSRAFQILKSSSYHCYCHHFINSSNISTFVNVLIKHHKINNSYKKTVKITILTFCATFFVLSS